MERKYLTRSEINRINGLKGGRPKGRLSETTIRKIKSEQTMREIIIANTGVIINDLLNQSQFGKTEASKELLGRAYGAVTQRNINENFNFSLADLANEREKRRAISVKSEENEIPESQEQKEP